MLNANTGRQKNYKLYVEVKKMNEIIEKKKLTVENMIFEIRGNDAR